jgi:hypothetical protein
MLNSLFITHALPQSICRLCIRQIQAATPWAYVSIEQKMKPPRITVGPPLFLDLYKNRKKIFVSSQKSAILFKNKGEWWTPRPRSSPVKQDGL